MIEDQRLHLRLPAHALECRTNLQHSLILDLSEGGLCLQLGAPVRVHEPIQLRCQLSGFSSLFEASCEVVWTDVSGGRAGVRFVSVPELSRVRLIEWLFQNSGSSDARSDAHLHIAAVRARLVTRADGVAIALGDGDAMLCRASSGPAAPPVGVRPDTESGLTMECLRTGDLVLCADAETDSRANLVSCRALGIRSAVVLPLQQGARILGLLAVFSGRPYAFDNFDIDALKRMAASIVSGLAPEHLARRGAAA